MSPNKKYCTCKDPVPHKYKNRSLITENLSYCDNCGMDIKYGEETSLPASQIQKAESDKK